MRNQSLSLFNNTIIDNPKTQGVKYAGSKLKLLTYILSLLENIEIKTVFDGFSGTTRVSQAFARCGLHTISNDISEWSYIFGLCYLQNKKQPAHYQELIAHLNAVKGYDGWFTYHYGGVDFKGSAIQLDGSKRIWQIHNTQKLDAIREEIDMLKLSEIERAVALTSLILAMDEIDSSLGHHVSYLRQWSSRSYKNMKLKIPNIWVNEKDNIVIKSDIFNALKNVTADLAYFDPPYGSNNEKMPPSRVRYASYYHLWTTIILNDKPNVFGVSNRRVDCSDKNTNSVFEDFRREEDGFIAVKAIENLIKLAKTKYIALSYSSGGKATANELNSILTHYGTVIKTIEVDYKKNVMAEMKWTNEWLRDAERPNREFIFLIEK